MGGALAFKGLFVQELLLPKEGHPDRACAAGQGVPVPVGWLKAAMRLDMVGLGSLMRMVPLLSNRLQCFSETHCWAGYSALGGESGPGRAPLPLAPFGL